MVSTLFNKRWTISASSFTPSSPYYQTNRHCPVPKIMTNRLAVSPGSRDGSRGCFLTFFALTKKNKFCLGISLLTVNFFSFCFLFFCFLFFQLFVAWWKFSLKRFLLLEVQENKCKYCQKNKEKFWSTLLLLRKCFVKLKCLIKSNT